MQDSNYIKIYTDNFLAVQRAQQELQQNDIQSIVKDENESARLAGFGSSVGGLQDLFVLKDDFEKATLIIKNMS